MTLHRKRTLLPVLIAAAFAFLADPAVSGSETAHDIIPETWITYNGCAPDAAPGSSLLVLPFQPGSGKNVHYPAPGFLARGSRFKSECFRFRTSQGGAGQIDVTRPDPKSLAVTISALAATQKQLRSMEWAEFQKVQAKFEQFLFEKSACNCICIFTSRPPRQRFGEHYEEQLREFWLECLKGSGYDAFAQREKERTFGSFPQRPPADDKMGVIPLFPGMRLSIHWGSTAVYPIGTANLTISRPTVAATTTLPVQRRGDTDILGAGFNWKLSGVLPVQRAVAFPPDAVPVPFGSQFVNGVAQKLVTVFNEYDLRHENSFLQPAVAKAARMYLLVPHEYTRADFPKNAGTDANAQVHIDARDNDENPLELKIDPSATNTKLYASLARRFRIWRDDAKSLDRVAPDGLALDQWPYPAMVFGNQAWVEPELALSLNAATTEWLSIGTTLQDVVDAHAAWLPTRRPQLPPTSPLMTLFRQRDAVAIEKASERRSLLLRFWVLPPDFLTQTEVHPGDALFFKP
jgi:hypothetical protein